MRFKELLHRSLQGIQSDFSFGCRFMPSTCKSYTAGDLWVVLAVEDGFASSVLCVSDCWLQVYASAEHIPSSYTAADFVRVSAVESEAGDVMGISDWTEAETLRLLEALEQFGEDWGQVRRFATSIRAL